MMKKNNNNFIFASVRASISFVFLLILIVSAVGTSSVDAKPKGVNIIKHKRSTHSIPSNREELQKLTDQLNNNPTETELALINERLQEIEEERREWFASHEDVEKEEEARKNIEMMLDFFEREYSSEEGDKELTEKLPYSFILYDEINHCVEVSIIPEKFNDKNIKKYIKFIREIIGDEVDLTISQENYPSAAACTPNSECDPMLGGNRIAFPKFDCTIGFKAEYKGKKGFVTAGHCSENIGDDVGQPTPSLKVGETIVRSYKNFTKCDCAFIEIDPDINDHDNDGNTTEPVRAIDPEVIAPAGTYDVSSAGFTAKEQCVRTIGSVIPFFGLGEVEGMNVSTRYEDGTRLRGLIEAKITTTFNGDSGGSVLNAAGDKLIGTISGLSWDSSTPPLNSISTFIIGQGQYKLKFGLSNFSWDFN